MIAWSGPGRALTEHLARFEKSAAGVDLSRSTDLSRASKTAIEQIEFWRMFARSYTDNSEGATASAQEKLGSINAPHLVKLGSQMMSIEHDMLNEAVTHYVSQEIIELVSRAAELADPEPLFPTDTPCPNGIAILERPVVVPDLHPTTGEIDLSIKLPVRAIGWHTTDVNTTPHGESKRGIIMIAYTDQSSYNSIYLPSVTHIDPERVDGDTRHTGLSPIEFCPWGFGTIWGETNDIHETDANAVISTVSIQRRWLLSLFRLMWQEILTAEPIRSDRAHRRRCDRINWSRPESDIKIVRLRKIYVEREPHEHPEGGWTLNHRVIVRGHWRRQYYSSLGEVGDDNAYRRIWIDPHIKGPESGPLVLKHSITSVVR